MIFTTLAVILAYVSSTEAVLGTVCKNNTDCGPNECCYIQPEFLVVSRRDLPLVLPGPVDAHHDTGVCEGYQALHDPCGPLDKMNGHCSCGAQMSCQFVPEPTDGGHVISKRKIWVPGPGTFKCELIN